MNIHVNVPEPVVQPPKQIVISLSEDEGKLLALVLGKLSHSTVADLLFDPYREEVDAGAAYDLTAAIYFALADDEDLGWDI